MLTRLCVFTLFLLVTFQNDVVTAFVNRMGLKARKSCPASTLWVSTTPSKAPTVSASKEGDADVAGRKQPQQQPSPPSSSSKAPASWSPPAGPGDEVTPKSVTNEIMEFFSPQNRVKDAAFQKRLANDAVRKNIDGLHVITVLFQSARSRRQAKTLLPAKFMADRLKTWDREWSERDISMFVYGVRALEGRLR